MKIHPSYIAVIPLIPGVTDKFFNKVLQSPIFTPELLAEALAIPQKFKRETKADKPYQTETGFIADIWSEPGKSSAANGITVLSQPQAEGIIPHRLYTGPNVPGFILLYAMSCCKSASVNAVVAYPDPTKKMKVQLRPSAEGAANGKGLVFQGKVHVAGPEAVKSLDHLWAHVRGTQHTCHAQPKFDVFSLDGGPRPS